MCFFKRKDDYEDTVEVRFDHMMSLVKDLSRRDYNRLKEAMDLGYDSYQKVRNVKTADEREFAEVEKIEKTLKKEVENGGK